MTYSILIVDDEPSICMSLSGLLSDEGFETSTAASGYEALDKIHAKQPDIVILDVWLVGIDGIETLKRIKKRYPNVEVIMITGHGTIEVAVKATKIGAYDLIEKPLSIEKLTVSINKVIELMNLKSRLKVLEAEKIKRVFKKTDLSKIKKVTKQKQAKKKLSLKNINLANRDIHDLYSIVQLVFSIGRHNFGNKLGALSFYAESILRSFENLNSLIKNGNFNHDLQKTFGNTEKDIVSVRKLINQTIHQIKFIFGDSMKKDFQQIFVSKPHNIAQMIIRQYQDIDIKIDPRSLKTLEIVFPENILSAIFDELVNNFRATRTKMPKVRISWKIKKNSFICSVHDNGPCIIDSLGYKPILLSSLTIELSGLSIINNIISRVGGYVTCSRSKNLKGTMVHIEFPVNAYYIRGEIYEYTSGRERKKHINS